VIVKSCWAGSRVLEENSAWKLVRSPMRPRDKTLAPEAEAWLGTLPLTMHPQELCLRYPRIANRMALLWPDAHLTETYFTSLLADKRGGRRGFAPRITEELTSLHTYYAESRGGASGHDSAKAKLLRELHSIVAARDPATEVA
jgi:hypothetical protein